MKTNHPANNGSNWNGAMSKNLRMALYIRAGFTCAACGRSALGGRRLRLSLDHLRAVSLGGSDEPQNLVVLCQSCNSSKGKLTLKAWLAKGGHRRRGLCASAAVVERQLLAQAADPVGKYAAAGRKLVSARRKQLRTARAAKKAA